MNKKIIKSGTMIVLVGLILLSSANQNIYKETIQTSVTMTISNKKIGWGIKRADNHVQPDLGSTNKNIIEKYNGICIGNKEKKYIYLTFDEGYEAGYTKKILEILKENEVPATFFITGHYLNSQPELVQRMISEGHTVGNQSPHTLMEL